LLSTDWGSNKPTGLTAFLNRYPKAKPGSWESPDCRLLNFSLVRPNNGLLPNSEGVVFGLTGTRAARQYYYWPPSGYPACIGLRKFLEEFLPPGKGCVGGLFRRFSVLP